MDRIRLNKYCVSACLVVFFYCFEDFHATPVQFHVPPGTKHLNISRHGIDVRRCSSIVYQARGCSDAMVRLDGADPSLFTFVDFGSFGNTKTSVYFFPFEHTYNPNNMDVNTPGIMDCNTFRYFWITWNRNTGLVVAGRGQRVGHDVIISNTHPDGHLTVDYLGLMTWNDHPAATLAFGEENRSRFELQTNAGRFADGLIMEMNTNISTCSRNCHQDINCGMFSYHRGQGLCALYDRMTSSFNITSQDGWQSWKMLYC